MVGVIITVDREMAIENEPVGDVVNRQCRRGEGKNKFSDLIPDTEEVRQTRRVLFVQADVR